MCRGINKSLSLGFLGEFVPLHSPLYSFIYLSPETESLIMSTPLIKLNSGYQMPQIGFGLWKVDNDTCADTVYEAIKAGYRLFDGACGTFKITTTTSIS